MAQPDQVKVIKEGDTREGQAGYVLKRDGDEVSVKFDLDNEVVVYNESSLQHLG